MYLFLHPAHTRASPEAFEGGAGAAPAACVSHTQGPGGAGDPPGGTKTSCDGFADGRRRRSPPGLGPLRPTPGTTLAPDEKRGPGRRPDAAVERRKASVPHTGRDAAPLPRTPASAARPAKHGARKRRASRKANAPFGAPPPRLAGAARTGFDAGRPRPGKGAGCTAIAQGASALSDNRIGEMPPEAAKLRAAARAQRRSGTRSGAGLRTRYRIEIASPLRSRFAIRPTCRPLSSSSAPFSLRSTITRAPAPMAAPAPAAP